jgi:hypothetical protein
MHTGTPSSVQRSERRRRALRRNLPVFLALIGIGTIYAIMSERLSMGPRWLTLGLIVVLIGILVVAIRAEHLHVTRSVGLALLGLITAAEAVATTTLVVNLLLMSGRMAELPQGSAMVLLRDAALIWLVNILTFSFWYWELDGGGPAHRLHAGYTSADLVFPQASLQREGDPPWIPHYVDYLFLAFNTSTALSPTDTLILSPRLKLLMMTQALISLTVLAIIASRAINTL